MEPLYVVLIINLIVWGGIFYMITRISKEVDELKSRIDNGRSSNG